jgi:hypothetical protein
VPENERSAGGDRLQRFSRRFPSTLAQGIHIVLLTIVGLSLVLAAWMLVSILLAGFAVILGPACALLGLHSGYVVRQIPIRRAASVGAGG